MAGVVHHNGKHMSACLSLALFVYRQLNSPQEGPAQLSGEYCLRYAVFQDRNQPTNSDGQITIYESISDFSSNRARVEARVHSS
jgi:hypothetical protein